MSLTCAIVPSRFNIVQLYCIFLVFVSCLEKRSLCNHEHKNFDMYIFNKYTFFSEDNIPFDWNDIYNQCYKQTEIVLLLMILKRDSNKFEMVFLWEYCKSSFFYFSYSQCIHKINRINLIQIIHRTLYFC